MHAGAWGVMTLDAVFEDQLRPMRIRRRQVGSFQRREKAAHVSEVNQMGKFLLVRSWIRRADVLGDRHATKRKRHE
ncbi:MAG: hypothetical protein COW30_08410 [Rhodospirillales bacterium CG15_BIG_FIL_POST_REV_8_21_14_020_66_15]|nr:MAG: hypothetical protein COW30_08410 [Rhodospirillales bacterium CG15_BIG_FIL_POST_REV_8_21_14_020_66_15]